MVRGYIKFVVLRSFEHQEIYSTFWLCSNFKERTPQRGRQGTCLLSFPTTNHSRRLAARRLLCESPCRTGTIHLQTPTTFQVSLSKPNNTA
ncbi:hypothetical protein TNCV_1381051 [Trichonephila clavipes]|nr:hypothetical protein TNCV_1381051 [Trichonephila clavipes]